MGQAKVNIEDVKVGDLVEMTYTNSSGRMGEKALGYVTKVDNGIVYAYWSDEDGTIDNFTLKITGHWKVIDFTKENVNLKEENKMNENHNKVYTGKEAIEALFEGKTLEWATDKYKIEDGIFLEKNGQSEWFSSYRSIRHFMTNEFTEYVPKPQVGDWVRVTCAYGNVYVGKIDELTAGGAYSNWNGNADGFLGFDLHERIWEILTPEQVTEYKRTQVFERAGRKLNEFKLKDVIIYEGNYTSIVGQPCVNHIRFYSRHDGRYINVAPNKVTPAYFVESKVSM